MPSAAPTPRPNWADTRAAPALVAAAAFVASSASLFGGFVADDARLVLGNPGVRAPESWLALLTDPKTADPGAPSGVVAPLRTVDLAADHALFGDSPFGFHLHSVLWHVVAATLLFFVLRRLLGAGHAPPSAGAARATRGHGAAFAAALLWAVHPIHAEAVAWIASRGEVAAGACALASVFFALRTDGFDRDLALSLAAATAAPFFKETAWTLWIVVAALRFLKMSRAPVLPYVGAAVLYLVCRRGMQPHGDGNVFILGGSVAGTLATASRAFGFHLVEPLLPAQSTDWHMTPSTSFADAAALAWLFVHAAIVASALALRTRAPRWTLAVLWFYAFLLPAANWPVFIGLPTAERFLYLPLAGVAVALGAALVRAPRAAWTASIVAAAALGASTIARASLWRDDDALMRGVLADHESPGYRGIAGDQLAEQALVLRSRAFGMPAGPELDSTVRRVKQMLEDALEDEHRAIAEWEAYEVPPNARGLAAMRAEFGASNICSVLNRPQEALFHAEQALRIRDEGLPQPHYDRAMALLALGFAPQAMESMRKARGWGFMDPRPDIGDFFLRAADACAQDGLHEEALAGYTTALDACPPGPMLETAKKKLAEEKARTPSPGESERDAKKVAEMDEALKTLPRWCAWRSGPAGGK